MVITSALGRFSPWPPHPQSALASVLVQPLSRVRLFATPWTVACQAPLSMGFPRKEYWSELPFPSPGDLSDSGIKLRSPVLAGRFFIAEPPGKPCSVLGTGNY